jgi:GABA(A) receptor-associated protein
VLIYNTSRGFRIHSAILARTKLNEHSIECIMPSFKESNPLETRIYEAGRIMDKFPGRIPVIVERSLKSLDIAQIDKTKFLVPSSLTIGQFMFIIRKRIELSSEQALFLYVGNVLPTTSSIMSELYSLYKDSDNFLYCTYTGENVFG